MDHEKTSERQLRATRILIVFSVVSAIDAAFGCQCAFAYRPFVSTDAAVADEHTWDIELGFVNLSQEDGQTTVATPSLRVNYGLRKNWEVVGEADVQMYQEGPDRDSELREPGLSLKGVVREGVLQHQQGPSVALESGILLPSTVRGEGRTGFEGLGVVSGRLFDVVYHLNLGGELDRHELNPNGLWGVIIEYPFEGKIRLVGEVTGVVKRRDVPENSGLLGIIVEVGRVDVDVGVRAGLSAAAPDWGVTSGITFSF